MYTFNPFARNIHNFQRFLLVIPSLNYTCIMLNSYFYSIFKVKYSPKTWSNITYFDIIDKKKYTF